MQCSRYHNFQVWTESLIQFWHSYNAGSSAESKSKLRYSCYAGVFHEPTLDLVKVLGKLLDENNRIQIPGWYTPVRHNTLAAALERLDALEPPEFTLQEYKETLGIPELNDTVRYPSQLMVLQSPFYSQFLALQSYFQFLELACDKS